MKTYCLMLILLLIPAAFGVTGQVTSFYGQNNPLNITFTGNENQTFYVSLPTYASVQNFSINLNLINYNADLRNLSICYQETANASSGTDGACGLNYTGNYTFGGTTTYSNPGNLFDGNYISNSVLAGAGYAYFYVNYTKPNNFTDAIWYTESGNAVYMNITVPDDCFSYHPTYLMLAVNVSSVQPYVTFLCRNETTWKNLGTETSNNVLYDEGVYWKLPAPNTTFSVAGSEVWNTSTYNVFKKLSLNTSFLNSVIQACTCTGCSLEGSNCLTPFKFHADDAVILETNLTNATYAYGMDNCSVFTTHGLNFTALYENNLSTVPVAATGTVSYTAGSLTSQLFFDYLSSQNFSFCIDPTYASFNVDYSVTYHKVGETLAVRTKSENDITVTSATTISQLYVLSSDTAGSIRIKTTDIYSNPIASATITVIRNIAGTNYTIQTSVSDSSGMAYPYLDTTQQYTIVASKVGYTSVTETITPTTTDIYTLVLGQQSTTTNNYAEGIYYRFAPQYELKNNTQYSFTFNLTSSYWNISNCLFRLSDNTSYIESIGGTNGSVCNIQITANTGKNSSLTGLAIYGLNGTNRTVSYTYPISDWTEGDFTVKTFFYDLKNFTSGGFNEATRVLVIFVIIFALVGVAGFYFGGFGNPTPMIILFWSLVALFSYLELLTVTLTGIPEGIAGLSQQYIIFVLISILSGSYLWWQHAGG